MNEVQLCPQCGSGKIEVNGLAEQARCLQCSWEGTLKSLLVAKPSASSSNIVEVLGTPDTALGIVQEVSKNYLLMLSEEASGAIGKAMVRSGLVGGKEDPKDLGRIIKAATLAAHKATLDEIEAIQQEKQHGRE